MDWWVKFLSSESFSFTFHCIQHGLKIEECSSWTHQLYNYMTVDLLRCTCILCNSTHPMCMHACVHVLCVYILSTVCCYFLMLSSLYDSVKSTLKYTFTCCDNMYICLAPRMYYGYLWRGNYSTFECRVSSCNYILTFLVNGQGLGYNCRAHQREALDRGLWARDRQLYVCMYVRHAFGMQLRLSACAMATLFVLQMIHAYSPPCVRASACMHALQLMYQYLDYNTSKVR